MLGDRFKKAREFLGSSRNSIAKKLGLNHSSISRIESNEIQNPNWHYVEFLIKHGINPYFLIGESDDIHGIKTVNMIPKEDHERILKEREEAFQKLQNSIPKAEYEKLLIKYETMQEAFKLMNTHQ